jgi:hypothetical protein
MAIPLTSHSDSLSSLSAAFKNFRQSSGLKRPVIPPAMKLRALLFLGCGVKREELGRACGVSKHTIALWKTQALPPPRQLVVVPESEPEKTQPLIETPPAADREPSKSLISFHLRSGISFEVSGKDAVWLVSKLGEVK